MTRLGCALVAIAALGCGKGDKGDQAGGGGGGGDEPRGTGMPINVNAVNSLVPDELKAKLEFEMQDISLEQGKTPTTYRLAAPKGWTRTSKMFGNLEPPKNSGLGFFTKLKIGSNCDGACEPKDWEAIADKINFAPLASGKVLKDEKIPGARLMVVEEGDKTTVVHAWWQKGAPEYYTCTATLDAELKGAAYAFEKACQAVSISGGD